MWYASLGNIYANLNYQLKINLEMFASNLCDSESTLSSISSSRKYKVN